MILKDFLPDPQLSDYVQWYRIVHFGFNKAVSVRSKMYPPKPENVLHFFLRDKFSIEGINGEKQYQPSTVFVGQKTIVTKHYTNSDFLNFQIVFQPTALYRLMGIPSFELTNQYLDAVSIFSSDILFVHDALQHAKSYDEMLLIAHKFVIKLISNARKEPHLLDCVSRWMMKQRNPFSLDELAKESCLCTKQFKRKFNERIGVNPKTYDRIIRFTKAYNTRNAQPKLDWLSIAIDCDYYDYQHLVKDYKDFTGLTPNEFHILESYSPERVLGLTDELYQSRAQIYRPSF